MVKYHRIELKFCRHLNNKVSFDEIFPTCALVWLPKVQATALSMFVIENI